MQLKTARDYSGYRNEYFRPEIDRCPSCGSVISRHHIAWRKHLQTMKGNIYATSYAYSCISTMCGKTYRSMEADMLSLPYRTYGIDVIVEIGYLRHEEKRSMDEILKALRSLGIRMSRTECYILTHVFEELIAIRPVEFDPDWYDQVIGNGGIILAVDGVQPERGNSTLYVLQDALTSKVLYADYLNSSSSDNIASMIGKVRDAMKRLDIPIIAVISDHQASIRIGVEKALPGVNHQFCHFHVLRNALKPIIDMDRGMKKNMRKRIRGISTIESSIRDRDDPQAYIIRDACSLLRGLLIYPGTTPLDFSGMKVFQELASLDGTLGRMDSAHHDHELQNLMKITGRWREFAAEYRDVASLARYAASLMKILSSRSGSDKVRAALAEFIGKLRRKMGDGGIFSNLGAMVDTIEHHWNGLFFCYDDPRIPRTDNGLEITIRHNKTSYRRISGMQSWDSFMAQYGRSSFLIPPDVSRDQFITMTMDIDRNAYMKRWKEFNSSRKVQSLMRTARNDYTSALRSLENRWTSL